MMPDACDLKEQLQHCKAAARVDFKAHKKEANDLKAALASLVPKEQHSRVAAAGQGSGDLNPEEVFMVRALG
jgi:hypothetical protein